MNSLANLNAVVNEQDDPNPWPAADQGWDPPVATICSGSSSDSRLHYHHSASARQEWDWSDSQMILASQYAAEDHELDCKPSILQMDALGGSGSTGLGLRQYTTGFMQSAAAAARNMGINQPIGTAGSTGALQSSWPGLLNAVPLRQQIALVETSGGSGYSSSPLIYGGGMAGGSNNHIALGTYYNTHQSQMLQDMDQRRIHDILERGMYSGAGDLSSGRLGLNLGGRTYFSSEDMGTRFHGAGGAKRFRPNSPSLHVPSCQAEGCKADLSMAKHYHRRHKVCEYHSKAATVIIAGNTQRFCQQCSRFHALTEFDEGKRSCRKRLADHNRRRRKPQPAPALPPSDSAVPTTEATTSGVDNPAASNQDQSQDAAPGTAATRSQSDQQGGKQSKELGVGAGNKTASSSSTEQQTTSLLSTMTLAPSVSLTLQNGGGKSEMQSTQSSNMQGGSAAQDLNNEKDSTYMNDRHPAAPFLLSGPSLSLSSNSIASNIGVSIGGEPIPSTNHQSPAHPPNNFNEVELSVPWLRGSTQHVGSSPRMGLMQESLGKLSSCHQSADEGSIMYNSNSTTSSRKNANGQYFNEHGRLLAEHMQNLRSQAAQGMTSQDHHHSIKMENWMLENTVARDGQTVLSLLETASTNPSRKKSHEYSGQVNPVNANHHHHHHHRIVEETHESAEGEARRSQLGFLQQHHHHHHHHHQEHQQQHQAGDLHLNSASPSHLDHEASNAALSLHCMQVLRPFNESLYTTADFIKDGFV